MSAQPHNPPSRATRHRVRPWLRTDRRGTTTLELAIIAPVFFAMLVLVFEVGYQLVIDMALHIAVSAGSRYGITGQGYAAGVRDATIVDTAVLISGGLIDKSKLVASMSSYASPASYASGGGKIGSSGGSSQVVLYTYSYTVNYLTGFPAAITGKSSVTHTATLLVQNEPF